MELKYIFLDLYVLMIMLVLWCAFAAGLYYIAKWSFAIFGFVIQLGLRRFSKK
jgi:hypothetical protein